MQVPPFSLSKQLTELGPDLEAAVLNVLRSGQYIGGQEIKRFEEDFARIVDVPYVVGCNSGTDALVLALRALDIGPGDEVITSSFSFFATAESISAVGAKPVFVDVHPNNYLIDLTALEKLVNPSTKAIMPVHLFGCPVDMNALMSFARKKGLKVIEDCAQACGASWCGRSVGSWGDIGCFSFFPTKNLGAAGDAGAVTTKDLKLAKKMRDLSVHGMPRRYLHTSLGYNSRLDAIQAAVLNVKLPSLSHWVEQRRLIASRYHELLKDLLGIELPATATYETIGHAWNQYVIRVNLSRDFVKDNFKNKYLEEFKGAVEGLQDSTCRDLFKKKLEETGVNTIIYYPIPIHLQPAYRDILGKPQTLKVTEKLCSQVLSLPIFPELSIIEQQKVVDSLKLILQPGE